MRFRTFAFVVLALSPPAAGLAQSGNSTISGVIKDSSGASIPGVSVTIRDLATGVAYGAVTNDEGLYRVGALVPGDYRVEAMLDGFDPAVRAVTLAVSQTIAIDLTLGVARQTEVVSVEATVPLVDSQTSNIAQTVTREMLAALPLPNRAASSLVSLAPGVVMIDTGTGTAENYPVFSVAGGRARNQNFILDGGNASNAVGLTRPQQLTTLPVDAMQEFKVITNNYAAEFGHSTGGVIVMSTRSGSNQYRGTVFESFRNSALDAKNYFAASKPPINLNQFGGTFGGPIRRGKTFFFGSWERTRQLTSETVLSTVPTLRNRAGDFSDLRSSAGASVIIYDPLTRRPFVDNIIPVGRIDPVAAAALQYYPLPNREGTEANANNYVGNSDSTLERDILVGRLDHQLRMADLLTVRYYINNSGTNVTGSYGAPVADPLADSTDVRVQSLTGAHTHVFSSTLVNELRVTYLRRTFIEHRPGPFPAFTIPGYAPLSSANVARFQTPIVDRQLLESVSWSRGRHAYKFGGEFRAGANDEVRDRGSSGSFTFTPLITSNLGAADTGNALASFLLGEVNAATVQISDRIRTRASYAAFYAQDDWRVTDRLTLNYGLRWEAELPRREVDNKMNSFDPLAINPVSSTLGVVTFAGRNGTPERAFATDVNNFGPRVGFAWQLNRSGRTVLRGGTGIFYGPTVSNTIGDAAALGFSTSASFVVSQATTESAFKLRDGLPAYARPELNAGFGAVPPGTRPNTAVSFFDPHQVAPTSYQMNLDVQHELSRGFVAEVGYIGNISRHLTANDLSINQVPPALVGPGDTQALRPFPQFSNVTLINPSIGKSIYHAAFARVEKRFNGGFSLLAHYTKSRFMDDVESANEYGVTGSYMDRYNRKLDWARSASDVPDHVVLTASVVVGGWRVSALETLMSGPPFTVITAANTTNAFPAGPLRPNLVGNPELPGDNRTLGRWFNTAAFENPANFTFGNSPRSVLRGPGLTTLDTAIERTVPLRRAPSGSAGVNLDLRASAYNVLNRANFNLPGFTLGAADFGVISSARPGRTVELGARVSF